MPKLTSKSTPKGPPQLASQSQAVRASQRPKQPEPAQISQSQSQKARASQLKTGLNQSRPAENHSQQEAASLAFEGAGTFFSVRKNNISPN